jgi:urease accessory protein
VTASAPPGLTVGSATGSAAGGASGGLASRGVPTSGGASGGGAAPAADGVGASAREGITASASIAVDVDAGRPRIRWTHAWPIVLRPTGDARVHLVHGAGGPLGGDALRLEARVGAAATLAVRSAGATIVQPGRSGLPARWDTGVVVGADATLDWGPEPTVVTDGATFHTSLRVELGAGARAAVREVVVLGRHGGIGGRYQGRLTVSVDGVPLLAHATLLDGANPALGGPGGTAGARAVGTLLVAGRSCDGGQPDSGATTTGEDSRLRWAWTELDGPGRMLLAVGEPGAVIALLDGAAALLSLA